MESCVNVPPPQCAARSVGFTNLIATQFVQTFLSAVCRVTEDSNFPPDYGPEFMKHGFEEYDFIVVGGGTAGPVVAGRLSENKNHHVLLIEAGGDPPIESEVPGFVGPLLLSDYNWNYRMESNGKACRMFPGNNCPLARGRMLGGTAALNAMMLVRGNRQDYDNWENLGNPDWGWNTVLQYFKKSENYQPPDPHQNHGQDGPLVVDKFASMIGLKRKFLQAAKELGYPIVDDFREGHFLGYSLLDAPLVNGTRNTPAKAFLLNRSGNLHVIKNAMATKVNFDEQKRAVSVDFVYTDKNNKEHKLQARARKEIILSAGTIETPKLLMLSGVGPRDHLESFDIPVISDLAVGKNLHDHSAIVLPFKMNRTAYTSELDPLYEYFVHRKGELAALSSMDACGFWDVNNQSGIYPNMQVHNLFAPISTEAGYFPSDFIGRLLSQTLNTNGLLLNIMFLLTPKSRGYLELRSTNYKDQPIINPHLLDREEDMDIFLGGIREAQRFERSSTYRENGITILRLPFPACELLEYDSDTYWRCILRHIVLSGQHLVGTARMGPESDPNAVVDSELRVRGGIEGLRVADASIMPTIIGGNTMGPTIMIAERAADFIKEQWSD